jgi:cytoskeletal protein RodZ
VVFVVSSLWILFLIWFCWVTVIQMRDDETEFPDSTDSSGSTDELIQNLEDELDDDGSDNSSSDEEAESLDSRCSPSPISY